MREFESLLREFELEDELYERLSGLDLALVQVARIGLAHGLLGVSTSRLVLRVCGVKLAEAVAAMIEARGDVGEPIDPARQG